MSEMPEHDSEVELERIRQLTGDALETYLFACDWYVQENDLIGGTSIMPADEPPSSGWPEVAAFLSPKLAQHIAYLHNAWLDAVKRDEHER